MTAIAPLHSADAATVAAQDATKQVYDVTVAVTSGKRYALGVVALKTDSGDGIRFSVDTGGGLTTISDRTISSSGLANNPSSYFEDGIIWAATVTGNVDFRVAVQTGTATIEGVIIREPDATSGIVVDHGNGIHCFPLSCYYDDDLYQVFIELYTANVHLSLNGTPQGKLFDGQQYNDRYHNGGCIVPLSTGVLVTLAGNDTHLRCKYLPGGAIGSASTERTLATGNYSYPHAVPLADDRVVFMTRGSSNAVALILTNATDLVANSPVVVTDVVDTSARGYCNGAIVLDDGLGTEVVAFFFNMRNGERWVNLATVLYAPDVGTNGRWYSINGHDANVKDSLGTAVAPRFSSSQSSTLTKDGNGILIMEDIAAGQRYAFYSFLAKVTQWPDSDTPAKGAVFCGFTDTSPDTATTYANSITRFVTQTEATRKVSLRDGFFGAKHLYGRGNSYRVTGAFLPVGGDPEADDAYLLMTRRGVRLQTNQYAETTGLYYDFGGEELVALLIEDIWTTPVFTLLDEFDAQGDFPAFFTQPVYGSTTEVMYQTAENELHPTHRQGQYLIYDFDGATALTYPLDTESWTKFKTITLDGSLIGENMDYREVHVKFTDDADIGGRAHSTGQNIRFTDTSDNILPHKRHSFSITAGEATGYFRVMLSGLVASTNKTFRIFYDNDGAADAQCEDWQVGDDGHVLIASLDQDPGGAAPQMLDISGNGNHLTAAGSPSGGTGQLASALSLNGSSQHASRNLWLLDRARLTCEALVNLASGELANDGIVMGNGALSTSTSAAGFNIWRDDVAGTSGRTNTYSVLVRNHSNDTSIRFEGANSIANTADVWHGIACSMVAGGNLRFYHNGAEDANSPVALTWSGTQAIRNTDPFVIGSTGAATFLAGLLDEVRVSVVERTSAWLAFGYHNTFDADNGLTFGSEQVVGGGGVTATPFYYQHLLAGAG